jgi:uncharacterized protein involved in outer membrane biogenesis
MNHIITVGDILIIAGSAVVLIAVVGALFILISILNPFRSGH